MAHDTLRQIAQDFVGNSVSPAGMIDGGNALLAHATNQHNLVANLDAGDAGDVEDGKVHGDAAYDRSAVSAQQHIASGRELAVEAVTIAGGDDSYAGG